MTAKTGAGARRKGASTERRVANYLQQTGFPHADRRGSGFEASDLIGTPGISWEIKNQETIKLPAWYRQMEEQQAVDQADIGLLVIKRKGVINPGGWYAITNLATMTRLLITDGHGTRP